MNLLKSLASGFSGTPEIERNEDGYRLEGKYPNPEKGAAMVRVTILLALLSILLVPAFYYRPIDPSSGETSNLFEGFAHAMVPLLEVLRDWLPGRSLPDLGGWGYGLGAALFVMIFGTLGAELWRMVADRPYITITVDRDTVEVQRGRLGTPAEIPRRDIRGTHVGRRSSGAHDVLIAHGVTLSPVAVVGGDERHALQLKTIIDEMLAEHPEKEKS